MKKRYKRKNRIKRYLNSLISIEKYKPTRLKNNISYIIKRRIKNIQTNITKIKDNNEIIPKITTIKDNEITLHKITTIKDNVNNIKNYTDTRYDISLWLESKLLKLTHNVAEYDYNIKELSRIIVDVNPEFKNKVNNSYGKLYMDVVIDLSLLSSKYKNNIISKEEFIKQLNVKRMLIDSYEREYDNLQGKDNFRTSYVKFLINNINEAVWYKYFNATTGEYVGDHKTSEEDVQYRYGDKDTRKIINKWLWNNYERISTLFSEDEFVSKMDEVFEDYNKE